MRLPDTLARLHALTKADNVGLGLIALGVGIASSDPWFAAKCLLVWLLMLVVSSVSGVLIASRLATESEDGTQGNVRTIGAHRRRRGAPRLTRGHHSAAGGHEETLDHVS